MSRARMYCAVGLMFLTMGTMGYGKTYTYTITKDCGVDCMDASHRGGADATINVLCHSLWLMGVELPGDLSSASQVQSATLTVNWDCIQQTRDTKVHQYNHPWSDNATNGSCWTYWLQSYTWAACEPRQSAGVLDEDRLEATVGNGSGGDLNDGLIGAVSTYDVTQGVKNWLNGATNYGFGIWGVYNAVHEGVTEANTQTWERRFGFSAESAFPPVFTIEYTPSRPDYSSATAVWCFDEGSGTTVTDLSGNLHNGTLTGSSLDACWSTNHPQGSDGYDYTGNDALAFDPTASQHVTIPNSSALNPTEELTIQFWYKDGCMASTDSQFSYIAGQKDAWFIERYRADDTSDIRIKIYIKQEGFEGDWWNYGITQLMDIPQDGNWHHIAFTYSNSNSICKCYLDGTIIGSTSYSSPLATSTSDLWIGSFEASPARRHAFSIDEFMMFSVARSAMQIYSSYQLSLHSTTDAPTFSPAGPEICGDTEVTITAATGATIYYTTNGDTPTTSGTAYTSPTKVTVCDSTTLKAIAVVNNISSWVNAQVYSYSHVAAPTFLPAGPYISGPTAITMNCETEGARIYYTLNGTTPSATNGTLYTAPVTMASGKTLKAIAVKDGYIDSDVTSQTYKVLTTIDTVANGTVGTFTPSVFDLAYGVPVTQAGWINAGTGGKTWNFANPKYNVVVTGTVTGMTGTDTGLPGPSSGKSAWMTIGLLDKRFLDGLAIGQDPGIGYASGQYGFGMNGGLTIMGTGLDLAAQPAAVKLEDGWPKQQDLVTMPSTSFEFMIVYNFMSGTTKDTRSIEGYYRAVGTSSWSSFGTQPTLGYPINADGTHAAGYEEDRWDQTKVGVMVTHDAAQTGSLASISLQGMKMAVVNVVAGDANLDANVDVGDLGILAANYGLTTGATWDKGDFNGDGNVDVGDLGILAANYGTGSISTLSWADAYTQAFGTTSDADETSSDTADDSEDTTSSVCSSLGLSLIAGLAMLGLMLVKVEE